MLCYISLSVAFPDSHMQSLSSIAVTPGISQPQLWWVILNKRLLAEDHVVANSSKTLLASGTLAATIHRRPFAETQHAISIGKSSSGAMKPARVTMLQMALTS